MSTIKFLSNMIEMTIKALTSLAESSKAGFSTLSHLRVRKSDLARVCGFDEVEHLNPASRVVRRAGREGDRSSRLEHIAAEGSDGQYRNAHGRREERDQRGEDAQPIAVHRGGKEQIDRRRGARSHLVSEPPPQIRGIEYSFEWRPVKVEGRSKSSEISRNGAQ